MPSKTITEATCMCAVELSSRWRNVESSAVRRSGLAITVDCRGLSSRRQRLADRAVLAQGVRAVGRDLMDDEHEARWRAPGRRAAFDRRADLCPELGRRADALGRRGDVRARLADAAGDAADARSEHER